MLRQWHALHRYVCALLDEVVSVFKFGVNYDLLANLGTILLFYFQALSSFQSIEHVAWPQVFLRVVPPPGWLDLNISIYPLECMGFDYGSRLAALCVLPLAVSASCWLLSWGALYAVNRYKRVAADAASEPGMRATSHAAQSRRYGRCEARREGHDGAGSGGLRDEAHGPTARIGACRAVAAAEQCGAALRGARPRRLLAPGVGAALALPLDAAEALGCGLAPRGAWCATSTSWTKSLAAIVLFHTWMLLLLARARARVPRALLVRAAPRREAATRAHRIRATRR